jgi:uncharacterized protein YecE (DUF72 family)
MHTVSIGTSGYVYKDWKGIFYPETLPQKKWLTYYSQHFSTVEINATFYGSFNREIFMKWREQVGKGFTFTLKGTRYVTHVKRLIEPEAPLERFFTAAAGLGDSFTCVLWQFAKNFQCKAETYNRLEAFLKLLPQESRQVIEFRHVSWFTNTVFTLLNRYGVGFVINDSPHFPAYEKVTGDFVYIRFHGPGTLYASSYDYKQLKVWAEKIKTYREKYDVFCYFNNDYYGYAIANARELISLLT